MTFDVRAIWLISAVMASSFGLLMLCVYRSYPPYLKRVLLLLGATYLLLGSGFALRSLCPPTVPFGFLVLGNTCFAASIAMSSTSVKVLKRQRTPLRLLVSLVAISFLQSIFFCYIVPNITIQIFLFNFINAILFVVLIRAFWQAENGHRPFVDVLATIAHSILALTTVLVLIDYIRVHNFTVQYDFSQRRAILHSLVIVLTESIFFPIFLLMLSERQNRDLFRQAMHDPLTGLYNRRAFQQISEHELATSRRRSLVPALLLIDVDHFKQINDMEGHPAGDAVLRATANTLRQTVRADDLLCRWGGDEFSLLIMTNAPGQAEQTAQRILEALNQLSKPVSVSIGIATQLPPGATLSEMIDAADVGLYCAKQAGRRCYSVARSADRSCLDVSIPSHRSYGLTSNSS